MHAPSGHVHALYAALKAPEAQARLHTARFARDAQLVDALTQLLRRDDGRAWYGARPVRRAVARGAVGKGGGRLLLTRALFRAADARVRARYVRLVDGVRAAGGEVAILSEAGEAGRVLERLGGVAAVLTFPLLDLDEDEEGEDDDDEDDGEEGADGGGRGGNGGGGDGDGARDGK